MKNKVLSIILVFTLVMSSALSIGVYAETDSKYSKYIPENATTVTVENDGDITRAIRQALTDARNNATKDKPYFIIVPSGKYELTMGLHIYSNTTLYCVGTEFIRDSGGLLTCGGEDGKSATQGGYDDYKNITVIGGTWKKSETATANIFYFIHCTNVNIIDCTFDSGTKEHKSNSHLVEASAVNGLNVSGCTFKNNLRPAADIKNDKYCGGWEALQFDMPCTSEKASDDYKFDGTPSKNIVVENCTFDNCARGIGTHTSLEGVYLSGVTIRNNSFTNITDEAIVLLSYKNAVITGNNISAGKGICIQSIRSSDSNVLTCYFTSVIDKPKSGTYSVGRTTNHNITISNNTINAVCAMNKNMAYGIELYGKYLYSDEKYKSNKSDKKTHTAKKGNYELGGINVLNNNIKTNGIGIRARGVVNSTFEGNTINAVGTPVSSSQLSGILTYNKIPAPKKSIDIKNNKIGTFRDNGIVVRLNAYAGDIIGNTVSGTKKYYGIAVSQSGTVLGSISSNTIKNTYHNGIHISASTVKGKISGNTVDAVKTGCGIKINDYSKVSGAVTVNKVTNAKDFGIALLRVKSNITCTKNAVSKCGNNPIIVRFEKNTYTATVNGNTVAGKKSINGIQLTSGKFSLSSNTVKGCNKAVVVQNTAKGNIYKNTLSGNKYNKYYINSKPYSNLKTPSAPKVKSKKKGTATVTHSKISGITGYQIVYSYNSNFKSYKTVSVKGTKLNKTLKSLKKGKKCYFKIRTYSTVKTTTRYSSYSKVKAVKIK